MISKRLSEVELLAIRRVLGQPIVKLYSPALRIRRFWASARSFSLYLGEDEFLAIESDWNDTPKHGLNYHTVHATVLDHPSGVPRVFDDRGRKQIGYPVSVVDIGSPKSPVVLVTVLEHKDSCDSEHVCYDSGLIFRLADGRRFAIAVHDSIEGGLECATEPVAIDEFLAEDRVRLELK